VAKSPHKARAYNNLGYAYQLAGRNADAEKTYARALELDPDYTKAAGNLAGVRGEAGE
jgi:protein O-mannosyl-transferase